VALIARACGIIRDLYTAAQYLMSRLRGKPVEWQRSLLQAGLPLHPARDCRGSSVFTRMALPEDAAVWL